MSPIQRVSSSTLRVGVLALCMVTLWACSAPRKVEVDAAQGLAPGLPVAPAAFSRRSYAYPVQQAEPDPLPDDFKLELGMGLELQLALVADGRVSLAYGIPPSRSPVAARNQRTISYVTWSTAIPRERVQVLWSAIRLGRHREQRVHARAPSAPPHPQGVAGFRILAYGAVSELMFPSPDCGFPARTSSEYFEVLHALRAALLNELPSGHELDRALDALRRPLQGCARNGAPMHVLLELAATSGQVEKAQVLVPEQGAGRACAERVARVARFPRLAASGTAHVELRTQGGDATLEVVTDVPADLQIDDEIIGPTNQRVALPPGRHRLVVVASGRQPFHASSLTLSPGERVRIDLRTLLVPALVPTDLEFGIVRGSRDGRSPAYSLRVDAAGKVRYEGQRHVRTIGVQAGQITEKQLYDLWQSYLDVAEALKETSRPRFAGPRLFAAGASVRIVVRSANGNATLDLDGARYDAGQGMRVAELAHEFDRVLASARWTGGEPAAPRCEWPAAQADLKVKLETLARAHCGAIAEPLEFQVGVLGRSGAVASAWGPWDHGISGCVKRLLPLVTFPTCDVPSYWVELGLFGSDGHSPQLPGSSFRGDVSFSPSERARPGPGDQVAVLGGTLTLLHSEIAERIGHGTKLREPRPGYVFVLVHTRFVPAGPGTQPPALALDDRWGARWPSERETSGWLAPSTHAELDTTVFEVAARAVLGGRDFAWGAAQEPVARFMELHEDVRLVVVPESGAEQVALPSTRMALSTALEHGWRRDALWMPETLGQVRMGKPSDARGLLPERGQWLRIDHAQSQDSEESIARTLRREPDHYGTLGMRLAYMRVDGGWPLSEQRKTHVDGSTTAGWSRDCGQDEQAIQASLAKDDARAEDESCALNGFVAPWSCLAAFVSGSPEEALRLRMEKHRAACGPRDPPLWEEP